MNEALSHATVQRTNEWGKWALIGVATLYVAALILIPVVALVGSALAQGWRTFAMTITDPVVSAALMLSLQVAVIATAVNGIFGVIIAWVLVRTKIPGKRFLDALINLPFALSPVIAGYLFILLFGRFSPFAGWLYDWNLSIVFDMPGVALATIFVTLPLVIREVMPVFAALDPDQELAAATLGANGWLRFRAIVWPVARSSILFGLGLTFARALGEFGAVLVVGGDVQGLTETVPLTIFRELDERNVGAAYQLALLLGLISLALVFGLNQWKRRVR